VVAEEKMLAVVQVAVAVSELHQVNL